MPVPTTMPIGVLAAGGAAVPLLLCPPLWVPATIPPATAAPTRARITTVFPEPPLFAFPEGPAMLNCVIMARAVRPLYEALT